MSLQKINFDLIKHRRVIGINNAYGDPVLDEKGETTKDEKSRLIYTPRDWVDACWFGDGRWYDLHKHNLLSFKGIIAHCVDRINVHGLVCYRRGKPQGIVTSSDAVSWNRSSGTSAINFAFHLGVKTVVLLGFDMKRINDRPNWHQDHPGSHRKNVEDPYERFLRCFSHVASDAQTLGLEIINCTPDSAITQFPIMPLEEYLRKEVI